MGICGTNVLGQVLLNFSYYIYPVSKSTLHKRCGIYIFLSIYVWSRVPVRCEIRSVQRSFTSFTATHGARGDECPVTYAGNHTRWECSYLCGIVMRICFQCFIAYLTVVHTGRGRRAAEFWYLLCAPFLEYAPPTHIGSIIKYSVILLLFL